VEAFADEVANNIQPEVVYGPGVAGDKGNQFMCWGGHRAQKYRRLIWIEGIFDIYLSQIKTQKDWMTQMHPVICERLTKARTICVILFISVFICDYFFTYVQMDPKKIVFIQHHHYCVGAAGIGDNLQNLVCH
jgi:hypothetical protein